MSDAKQIAEWLNELGYACDTCEGDLFVRTLDDTRSGMWMFCGYNDDFLQSIYKAAQRDKQRIAELETALRLFVAAERGHGWRDCAPDTQERIAIDAARAALKGETT